MWFKKRKLKGIDPKSVKDGIYLATLDNKKESLIWVTNGEFGAPNFLASVILMDIKGHKIIKLEPYLTDFI